MSKTPTHTRVTPSGLSFTNHITQFTNYLNTEHLSPLTIKSYKSDVSRYLDWASLAFHSTELVQVLNLPNIQKYLIHLTHSGHVLPSTIERKLKSLTRFQTWYSSLHAPTPVADSLPLTSFTFSPLSSKFITFAILLLFIATLGVFAYRQFAKDATLTSAYPSIAVTPNRQLSFQGRLENASGTPITTATNFVFKLFTASSGGTELYSTGTCSITPDSDGVFNTQIGSTCGSAIASSVFTENAGVWLEVTVVAETLAPRQQIATVAYALNSETLQGFPLSSTISAIRNTIVPMNQWGEIILGEQSPRLTGASGTFQISAPALSITTATGTNGNITLAPDGTGVINLSAPTTVTGDITITGGDILDSNGNESIRFGTTASAVNEATLTNAATGGIVTLAATGGDTDIALSIDSKGADALNLNGTATGDILLGGGSGSTGCTVANATGTLTCTVGITASAIPFSGITSGTNTIAAMVVGAGASLDFTSTGTINSSSLLGGTWAIPGTIGSSTPNTGAFTTLSSTGTTTIGDNIADAVTVNSGAWTFANDTTVALTGGLNGLNFDSNTLSIDAANDRVGIGTAAPGYKLDVAGNTSIGAGDDGFPLYLFRDNNTQYNGIALSFAGKDSGSTRTNYGNLVVSMDDVTDGSEDGSFRFNLQKAGTLTEIGGLYSDGHLQLDGLLQVDGTGNSSIAGNVGIGDTTPDAKLEVLSTTEQLRLTYTDGTVDSKFTVDSSGNLTIDNTGTKTVIADDLQVTGGDILDSNGNESIRFGTTASAVNEATLTNAATAGTVLFAATGGDADIALSIDSKGADALNLNGTATGDILIGGGAGSTGCTVANATGTLTCTVGITASAIPFSGITSATNTTAAMVVGAGASLNYTSTGTINASSLIGGTWAIPGTIGSTTPNTGAFTTLSSTGTTTIGDNIADAVTVNSGAWTFANDTNFALTGGVNGLSFDTDTFSIDATNNRVGIGTTAPVATALLDLTSTTQGFLAPRMDTTQRDAITTPATGLMIYNTTTNQYNVYNGSTWGAVGGGGSSSNWRITSGALSPLNDTLDLLVGNVATASAKAGFINIGSGTPTATVSAGVAGGAYLTATGTLATTAKQTLTLGNTTTGNIVLAPGGVTALTAEGANLTAAGNVTLTSAANLIFGTTTLAETTSAVDSGAYVVGTFDEFTYSNATNVQGVLNDLDIQLAALTAGTSGVWTDAGTYLYATSGEVLGNAASGGANKIAGLYLGDSAPLAFGADNDFTFSFSGATLGSTLTAGTRFGINTTTALATLDVRSSLGTIPVASISGATAMSALIVDQSGIGDLFTASKSGDTKFVVTNAGNVGIGVSAPTNKLEIGGSTSTISNASGDITIDAASNNISFAGDSLINILNTYVSGELGLGLADAVAKLDVHGAVVGKALVMFNEIGDQDILTASSSGTPRFRLTNTGSLSLDGDYLNFGLTDGTSGYGIRDNAGTLEYKNLSGSWAGIGTGGGGSSSNWRITSGALSPLNDTLDLLVGGVATSSAKFAVLNVNSGTPTATISGSVAGNALSLTGDGTISTSLNRTLLLNPDGGNVGIGVAAPVEKLEVNGYIVGQRFVDSASSAYYLDPAATGTSLSIEGNIVGNGAFYLSTGSDATAVSIGTTGAGKLDAGTIDPPYTINGEKFATYMSSMTGVKEETTGVVRAEAYIPGLGYRATLDFAQALSGSDLWLFSKVSNLQNNLDKMVVLLSATGSGRTWYEINASAGQLYLYSDSPATISYRLTAPRFDATAWLNTRGDESESLGFVINDENTWSAPESPGLLSPIASDSPIMITAPVVITPPLGSSGAALVVEGEIDAATISARVAKLDEIQAETIIARNIIADTIQANHIIGLDAKIASLSAGLTDSEVESITDRIKARLALLTGNEATAEDVPVPQESTSSATGVWSLESNVSTASATLASADIDFVTINNYLAVIGQAVMTTLTVNDMLYANSIQSKCVTPWDESGANYPSGVTESCSSILALQPLGGIINLAANTLIVDSSGQVMVNGDFTVSGSILADSASFNTLSLGTPPSASSSALGALLSVYNEQGEPVATIDKLGNLSLSGDLTASGSANLAALTTGMITIASSSEASNSATPSGLLSSMTSSNATAGESKLVSPNTELTINSPYITPNSLVYLTPTGNTDNKVLYVKSKTSCPSSTINHSSSVIPCTPSFTVAIDAPASSDISFNWWVIQLKAESPRGM